MDHAPSGATPWPSEMLPPATTATIGLRRRAGDDSPYHAREAPAVAEPCLRSWFVTSGVRPAVTLALPPGTMAAAAAPQNP